MKKHNTLTIKGFQAIEQLKYTGEEQDAKDIYTISIVAGIDSKVAMKMKPKDYAKMKVELLNQTITPSKPVYVIKYKGQMFGYYPSEVGTVEDMVGIELFSKGKKWQALAALMFRPLRATSRFAHRKSSRYNKEYGVEVKHINDFKKDSLTYLCQNIDFGRMDLSFWDDFPWAILYGNLSFLMGSGLQFNLSIHPASLKSKRIRAEITKMNQNFQKALYGLIWQKNSQQLMSLSSTGSKELSTWLQESYSNGSFTKNNKLWLEKMKDNVSVDAWVITGDQNKGLINGMLTTFDNVLNDDKLSTNTLLTLFSIMNASKYNQLISWVI